MTRVNRKYKAGGQVSASIIEIMVLTCCVVGCHKRGGRDKVSFFRVPSSPGPTEDEAMAELTSRRRQAWIAKINRKDWDPSKFTRVCSDHFMSGLHYHI